MSKSWTVEIDLLLSGFWILSICQPVHPRVSPFHGENTYGARPHEVQPLSDQHGVYSQMHRMCVKSLKHGVAPSQDIQNHEPCATFQRCGYPCASVHGVCNFLKMGSHHPNTYKSMSPVPHFSDVGANVQQSNVIYQYPNVQKCIWCVPYKILWYMLTASNLCKLVCAT